MRILLVSFVAGIGVFAVAIGANLYRPWQYSWAFGQDAGAARSADWKDKPCSKSLAESLYADDAEATVAAKQGNRFFVAGAPGHTHYVYGFRSQQACEQARAALGTAQWDQSKL